MNRPDIEAIRVRCKVATPGPWTAQPDDKRRNASAIVQCDYYMDETPIICQGGSDWLLVDDDASFIAHAREDVPALLDYIEWLEAENESLNEQNEQITQDAQEHAQRQHYEHHRALEAARIARDNAIEETRRFRENHHG